MALLKFFKASGYESSFRALIKDAQLDKNVNYTAAADLATLFPKPATTTNVAAKNGVAVQPAKKAKKEESSDSDSSDSGSDDDAKKPAVKTVPVATKVIDKKSDSDTDSSSSSDSDSDEEEQPAKVSKPAAPVLQPTSAKKPSPAATKKVESDSSSSSSDSDSDDESATKPAPKKAAPAPVVSAAAKKSTPKPASSDESSSSSSDDEDNAMDVEEEAPKSAAKKAPSGAAKAAHTPSSNGNNGQEFKAYVKGLPWKASDYEVQDFFKECPDLIKAEVPMGDDGRSSGTAYVSFSSRAGLDAALALDGQYWPETERWLKIVESTEKPERKSFGGATPGEKPEGCDTVFVGNLPWDVDEDTMRTIFSAAGEVSSVRFASNPEDGSFRGFGHVSFFNGDDVLEAVKLAGTDINGRAIRVDFAPPRARKEFGGGDAGGRGRGRGRGDDGGRGRGRGGRDSGRGRGGQPSPGFAKRTGAAIAGTGKKISFD